MPDIKIMKDPGFLYDLNFLFYVKFNTGVCLESLVDQTKKEAYKTHLQHILQHFGSIPDDLYVFYHAAESGRCFMTTYYLDPYKNRFAKDFHFKCFHNLLSDTEALRKNLIRFYLSHLSEDIWEECFASNETLFAHIKASALTSEEKSKLYEFFIHPAPYCQTLQYELMKKEQLLSAYYKDHYETLFEIHNQTTFETLCENVKGLDNLAFLKDDNQVLYTSFCLLNRYLMYLFFVPEGAVYLLGYDYASIVDALLKKKKTPSLDELCGALSEASRVAILKLLLEREEITCKDLEKHFRFSGSTAYHHLSILTKIGALKVRNVSKKIYYSLNRTFFDTMRAQLKAFSNK